jgi:O-succinylbenzoate synthase
MTFRIDEVRLHHLRMELVHFFETSFGRTYTREIVLVEAVSGGVSGWGEVTCGEHPFYNEEWTESAWLLLKDYIVPPALDRTFDNAAAAGALSAGIKGHKMARGGFEAACWDLEARLNGLPLWKLIGGGARREIPCGVSIGIQDSVPQLLEKIRREVEAGYQRIKIKIKPGWDVDVIRQVRREFPSVLLMADANSAYRLSDIGHLKRLDEFGLMMIEQPLAHDEIIDHAELQAALETPVCLDECIRSAHHAEQAIRLGACRIINIKLGRVGGFAEAIAIHDIAQRQGIPVWSGGMLESGVGRCHNIAMATLANFTLPGDISASRRYWKRDIIDPWVEVTPRGTIEIRDEPGFGWPLDWNQLERVRVREETIRAK